MTRLVKEVLSELCSDVTIKNYLPIVEMLESLCETEKNKEILKSYLCSDISDGREKYYNEVTSVIERRDK